MVSETEATELMQRAKHANPQQAREFYLQAAEMFVRLSEILKSQKFLEQAELCYEESEKIGPQGQYQEHQVNMAKLLVKQPEINFKDIGGLEKLKEEISLKVIAPLKFPHVYELFKKKMGGGIIMYGPPGCGKSLIAEATAGEANIKFFHVKASDLKSKYVGETERNIAKLFETARKHQPCIMFFDEFEALGEERSNAAPQNKGAVSQLLTEINGLGTKDDQILLIAATNEPWAVDLALRREGRFGTTLFVPPPDESTREEILKLQIEDKPHENIDYKKLAYMTEGYSGADLAAVTNHAIEATIKDCIESKKLRALTTDDLVNALNFKKSSIVPWFTHATNKITALNLQDSFPEVLEFPV